MKNQLMKKSNCLESIVTKLTASARQRGLSDLAWAAQAGVRHETVSRLRHRTSCDFATLAALASAVGCTLTAVSSESSRETTPDGCFPARVDRDYEEELIDLCAADAPDSRLWESLGPRFFMSGLAVMIASVSDFERRTYLELAERLHAGASQAGVFELWLKRSPLRPSRAIPMILAMKRHAA
jgi:DNA-binding phage protein